MRLLRSTVDQLSPLRARMEALEGQLKEAEVVATSLKVRGPGLESLRGGGYTCTSNPNTVSANHVFKTGFGIL